MKRIIPNQTILSSLRCPICKSEVTFRDGAVQGGCSSLVCAGQRKHCYDLSSSGYVNWMPPGRTDGGDAKLAVRARSAFLNLELYRPIAEALLEGLSDLLEPSSGLVIDAGCGEGYYTQKLAQNGYSVLGVDLSKWAVDAAAKRMARSELDSGFCGVASVFELPVADASASAIVNIFAPCVEKEFSRALCSGGILAVAYAGPEHLMGLKRAIYSVTKENDGRADLPTDMALRKELRVRFEIEVSGKENLQNLFAMTPYYWRTSPSDSEKLAQLETLTTEIDVQLAFYQKTEKQ